MYTLIKTAFRVKSSQGTQAGATQGSPQIQAKDSPKSELLTKPCLRKRPNKKCHNNPAYYKVRSSVGEECRLGFIRCGKRAPSVRSINLSNLRARAGAGGGAGGIVHSRKYLLYLAPREGREEESVRECGFWRLASSLSALSQRDRAPPSLLPSCCLGGCKSVASVVALGPKTPHAREIRDIHSAAKVALPLLPDPSSVVRSFAPVARRLWAWTMRPRAPQIPVRFEGGVERNGTNLQELSLMLFHLVV